MLRTRGELAAVEYAQERERLKRSAITLAVALLMLVFALGGIGMWIVVYFWDTGRLTAIAVVSLVYALVAFGLWRLDSARNDADPAPFSGYARRAREGPPVARGAGATAAAGIMSATKLAARKALIAAQADLARVELALAWRDVRSAIAPPSAGERSTSVRRMASIMIAMATPLLGRSRFARVLRFASVGLAALRAIRTLRGGPR